MEYKQWISSDRCNLKTVKEARVEFIEGLSNDLYNLTCHHFIAKCQAQNFSQAKDTMKDNEAIIQLDFSENYTFILQDAVQASYFSSQQATVHPYVIYHKIKGDLFSKSFCIISNHLTHDAKAVAIFNEQIISIIKDEMPHITQLHYWSDGSAAQYKNRYAMN